jgi:hypothetical protein
MTTELVDAPLIDLTDTALARPLPDELARARTDVLAAATDILATPDSSLAGLWTWTGEAENEIRYGAYRAAEALERAESEAGRMLAAGDAAETLASRVVAAATAARWDLHGLVLPLPEETLDADPGGDEWTIRLVLGHILSGQRAYGWSTAWWAANPYRKMDPEMPTRVPEDLFATLPDEATTEAEGSWADLRARFDEILDRAIERLAGTPDRVLEQGSRWMYFPVTVGFRMGRWSSHIREHVIQLEKTLALLGRVPSEPERLVRHVLATYGRAEATVIGRSPSAATAAAATRIAAAAAEAREAVAAALAASREVAPESPPNSD